MNSLLEKLKNLFYNILTIVLNFVIKRDPNTWVFGSWMGNRFADNSRFLFQHIANDKKSPIKVVWATRNEAVKDTLKKSGYDVVLIGSMESIYWHLKAGVHLVSNLGAPSSGYKTDIDSRFSMGAKKIQLWHGVGIKACSKLANKYKNTNYSKARLFAQRFFSCSIFSTGGWKNCYWIVTSTEDARVKSLDFGIESSHLIIGNYARNSDDFILSIKEKTLIERLNEFKKLGYKLVIYLPTFRDGLQETKYINPLEISGFCDSLIENKIIWIEKRHSASNYIYGIDSKQSNVLFLESDCDVNILYSMMDLVISDYSSATSDALLRNIRTLDYIPDYNYYANEDRGFVSEYCNYHPGVQVYEPKELMGSILSTLKDDYFDYRQTNYDLVRKFLFGDNPKNVEWLIEKITNIKQ